MKTFLRFSFLAALLFAFVTTVGLAAPDDAKTMQTPRRRWSITSARWSALLAKETRIPAPPRRSEWFSLAPTPTEISARATPIPTRRFSASA